jgi:hypothetical protein
MRFYQKSLNPGKPPGGASGRLVGQLTSLLIAATGRVAIQALPGDIGDIFLGVVLFGFSLVMTFITVHRGAGPAVAAGAFTAGTPVIHRESMP